MPPESLAFDAAGLLKVFMALFAITDPLGLIPLYLMLTTSMTAAQRARTLLVMIAVATAILVVTIFAGGAILAFFGISMGAFRIAGGLLLVLIAIDMLHARNTRTKRTDDETEEAVDRESVAIVPLAIPMLAGPGAISTVVLMSHQSPGVVDKLLLVGVIVLLGAVCWLVLHAGQRIGHLMGRTGLNIVARLMGLILAAIGIEFIMKGLHDYAPSIRLLVPGM